jgi:hypothetical protein
VIDHGNDTNSGAVLPSTLIREAFQVLALAWSMFRTWMAATALFEHLKRRHRSKEETK